MLARTRLKTSQPFPFLHNESNGWSPIREKNRPQIFALCKKRISRLPPPEHYVGKLLKLNYLQYDSTELGIRREVCLPGTVRIERRADSACLRSVMDWKGQSGR